MEEETPPLHEEEREQQTQHTEQPPPLPGTTVFTGPVIFPMDEVRRKWRMKVVVMVGIAGVIFWGLYLGLLLPALNKLPVKTLVQSINGQCPIEVGDIAQLNFVTLVDSKTLRFNLTLLDTSMVERDTMTTKSALSNTVGSMLNSRLKLNSMYLHKMHIVYYFYSADGDYICQGEEVYPSRYSTHRSK